MIIGVLTISLHIPLCHSLKDKRRHLKNLYARLAQNYNVSVAEIDYQDKWQRAVVAVVHVGTARPVVNSVLSHILAATEQLNHLQVIDHGMEMIA